jgi:hypothetical protein
VPVGINGEYLRVTPAELDRAIRNPGWAVTFAQETQDAEGRAERASTNRHLTTHKAWHAIGYLLGRAGFPLDLVFGDVQFADQEDWGYGPPGYLTAPQVVVAAENLAPITFDSLTRGVGPADLAGADVYPQVWDGPDSLEWVRHWYDALPPFFSAAASDGHAMLLWLD